MLNVGKARHLVELYTGTENINEELFLDIMNERLRDFAARAGTLESSATIDTISGTQEYELSLNVAHVKQVVMDDYDITRNKIHYQDVKALEGNQQ
jgi:hypothetical protein